MVLVRDFSPVSRATPTILTLALLLIVACNGTRSGTDKAGGQTAAGDTSTHDSDTTTDTAPSDTAPQFTGTLAITTPEDGDIVNTDTLSVEVSVENFTLSEADIGAANVDGEGHWIATVDGTGAGSSGTSTLDIDLATVMDLITISEHELAVQLVPNDGDVTAFPSAGASLTFYYCACCPNCSG